MFYHVCARGKLSTVPHFSMVNICGPFEPYNSLNPFIGTRDVPVTNCSSLERISLENDNTACADKRTFINRSHIDVKYIIDLPARTTVQSNDSHSNHLCTVYFSSSLSHRYSECHTSTIPIRFRRKSSTMPTDKSFQILPEMRPFVLLHKPRIAIQ